MNKQLYRSVLIACVVSLQLFGNILQAQNITKPKIACPNNVWVNSYNGVMFYQRPELQYPNHSMPLQVTFYYNSSSYNRNLGYGTGWSIGNEMRYEVDSLGIVVIRGDGRRDLFKKFGNLFESPAGVFDKLSQESNKYILTGKQGDKYYLGDAQNPVIEKMEDRHGNFLNFTYTGKLLSSVSDNHGRSLNLTWKDSLLVKTKASFDTHEYTYQYDTLRQLVRVVNPMGFTTAYGYDTRGLLNEIIDPNGNKTQIFYNGDYSVSRVKTALTDKSIRYENNQTVIVDYVQPTNQFTTYRWDDKGRVIEKKGHCCGRQQKMEYDNNDNVIKRTDANGNVTRYTYDAEGNMLTATDPLGNVERYTYESNFNQITSYTDKKGNITRYSYDAEGNLLKVENPLSHTLEFTYGNLGQMLSYKDANGNITYFTNDDYGNITAITDVGNRTVRLDYDTRGNVTALTDAMGNTTRYEYSKQNLPVKLTNALGQNTLISYDRNGNRLSVTDPMLRKTSYKYNELGDVTEIQDPLNQITQYTRNAKSLVTNVTDAMNGQTRLLYDDMGQLSMQINAENDTTHYHYDMKGNLTGILQPDGATLQYTYNENDQVVNISDNVGLIAEYVYDANGNVITEKDGEGKETHYEYDRLNRVIKVTDPLGFFEQYEYDKNDKITKLTHKNGTVESFTYNNLNQLTGHKDAMNNVTRFTYDNNDNLSSVTDANNHATHYEYDALKRNTLITFADESTKQYWYDAAGNVQKYKDNAGNVMTYTYDGLNRLTQKQYPDNSSDQYSYDALGQMLTAINANAAVTFTYDRIGRILSENLNGKTTAYAYNTAGRLRSITYPGGRAIQEFYDTRNRLSRITEGSETLVTMHYDPNNRLQERSYSNGTTTQFTYNDAGLLTRIIDAPAISDVSMEYDKNGNMLYRKDNLYPNRSETYAYDNLQRLTGFKRGIMAGNDIPAPFKSITYGMDALGNRTIVTEDGVNTSYTAGSMNQYTAISGGLNAAPTYDGNGNMLNDHQHSYTYDYNNRMTGVDNAATATYKYDALGRRIQKQTAEGTLDYFYDGDHIIEEYTGNAAQANYLYGNRIDDILQMNRNGNDYFYHKNHLGSVMALSATNGTMAESYQYQPYGTPEFYDATQNPIIVSALHNDVLFIGRQWETESRLYYYRARHLSSEFGRFMQYDPLEYIDGFNIYSYVVNNPNNWMDNYGLATDLYITAAPQPQYYITSAQPQYYISSMPNPIITSMPSKTQQSNVSNNYYNIAKNANDNIGNMFSGIEYGSGKIRVGDNTGKLYFPKSNGRVYAGAQTSTLLSSYGKKFGNVTSIIGLGAGNYDAWKKYSEGDYDGASRSASETAGAFVFGAAGAWAGAKLGALACTPFSPAVMAACGVVGGIVGGFYGSHKGGELGVKAFNNFVHIPALAPVDPNEIIGAKGYDTLQWVSVNQVLPYTIYFENDPEFATASAQRVEVRHKLHPNADRNSFGLGSFGFGNLRFEINARPSLYQQRLDVRDSLGVFVDVTAGIDIVTQEAFWIFETIDPATGLPPIGVHEGFLPVNNPDLHNGEGFVSFFIKPRAACVTGDTITADAAIVFDINEAISTNVWKNTIDAAAPQSTLIAAVSDTEIEISFTAQDDAEGCGVKEIQLYVAINEESYEQAGVYQVDTVIYYPYTAGNTYRFYTSALDHVRNKEEFKPVPDFTLNESLPPTDIRLSNNTFYNYEEQGGIIGVLSTVDKISNQHFSYELVTGNGSTGNALFDIENDKLVVNHNFYCLPDSIYSVRVRTTNESSLSHEKVFTLQLLNVIEPDTIKLSDETCRNIAYDFYGTNLTETGIYYHTLQNMHGCDSVVELSLTVNPAVKTLITDTICEGKTYSFFDESLTIAGVYADTLQTVYGCDSIIELTLVVNPVTVTPVVASICQGESYSFGGKDLTVSGTYRDTLKSIHGCDSVIVLTLNVNQVYSTPVAASICQGESYRFGSRDLTVSGTYRDTLKSIHNCDSVVVLTLNVNQVYSTPVAASICQGESYRFGSRDLTVPGTYRDTLKSIHGCDSVIVLALTINQIVTTPITASICQGEIYDFFGKELNSPGTYNHTLQSKSGCDSLIALTLTVSPNPVVNLGGNREISWDETVTLDAGNGFKSYEWSTGDNTQTIVVKNTGDDMISIWVQVSSADNCTGSDTIQIIYQETVDINESGVIVNKESIKVFPNPTSGKINVLFDQAGQREIVLYDMNSKEIYRNKHDEKEIILDFSYLPNATYILNVNNQKQIKVVIVH